MVNVLTFYAKTICITIETCLICYCLMVYYAPYSDANHIGHKTNKQTPKQPQEKISAREVGLNFFVQRVGWSVPCPSTGWIQLVDLIRQLGAGRAGSLPAAQRAVGGSPVLIQPCWGKGLDPAPTLPHRGIGGHDAAPIWPQRTEEHSPAPNALVTGGSWPS